MGYFLAREGRRFVILEAGGAVGPAWRDRWDSLVLFTPRRYDALPGLAFPADPDGYPTRDEVIAYLEQYAEAFELPIEFKSAVRSLTATDGTFVVELPDRRIEASKLIAPATAGRATSPREAFSSSAAGTPASRSPRSCRRRMPFTLRSVPARRRCHRDCSGATSSGG